MKNEYRNRFSRLKHSFAIAPQKHSIQNEISNKDTEVDANTFTWFLYFILMPTQLASVESVLYQSICELIAITNHEAINCQIYVVKFVYAK